MIISNYKINNQDYALFPKNIKCDTFSLDVKFLCINIHLIKNFEKTFKKYHISLSQVLSGSYVKSFLSNEENDIFLMAKKIKNGYNANEVKITNKLTISSICLVTGLPKETVRRKTNELVKRNLLKSSKIEGVLLGPTYKKIFQNFVPETTIEVSKLVKSWEKNGILKSILNFKI